MKEEKCLVLIKPDAMLKGLAGNVISEIHSLNLKMVGIKIVNVQRELAEMHYSHLKEKPFYNKLIDHMTGGLHKNENVLAIAYKGENAIKKLRDLAGDTHPEEANPHTLRGKYGRVQTQNDCFENVVHVSDSEETAEKEINLWFNNSELLE